MSDERRKVLQMLKDGKISLDEANDLLNSLDTSIQLSTPAAKERNLTKRFIRIEVNSDKRDNVKVNVPLSLAKIAMSFIPKDTKTEMESHGIDLDSIVDAVEQGADGELVNIQAEDGTTVKIYLD